MNNMIIRLIGVLLVTHSVYGQVTVHPTSSPTYADVAFPHYGDLCNISAYNASLYSPNSVTVFDADLNAIYAQFQYDAHVDSGYGNDYYMPSHVCSATMSRLYSTGSGTNCDSIYYLTSPAGVLPADGGSVHPPIKFNYTSDAIFKTLVDECLELCYTLYGIDGCAAVTMFNDLKHATTSYKQVISCTPVRLTAATRTIACNPSSATDSMKPYMVTVTARRERTFSPTPPEPTRRPTTVTTLPPTAPGATTTTRAPTPPPTSMPTPRLRETLEFLIDGVETELVYNLCASNDDPSPEFEIFIEEVSTLFQHHLYSEAAAYLEIDDPNSNHLPWVGDLARATAITACVQTDGSVDIGFEVDDMPVTMKEINLLDRNCEWDPECDVNYPLNFAFGMCYPPNDPEGYLGPNIGVVTGQTDYTRNYCRVSAGTFKKCDTCQISTIYSGHDVTSIWRSAILAVSLSRIDAVFNATEHGIFAASIVSPTEETSTTLSDGEVIGIGVAAGGLVLGGAVFAVYKFAGKGTASMPAGHRRLL